MLFYMTALSLLQGCAIHYFDSKTGTENIWGFGHMQMKATNGGEGVKCIVRGTEVLGVGSGWLDQHPSLIAGWDRNRTIEIVDPNTAVCLEWPNSSFFNVRVGTNFPTEFFAPQTRGSTDQPKETSP